MIAKILYISDLHKRYKDGTSIKGQLVAQQKVQEDIINFCQQHEITHVIVGGDWYDRGFHGIGQAYGAIEMDRRLSNVVNGNVYLCIGNHFYLERDENPEMYIIQPNNYIRPIMEIPVPEKPIFQVVPQLMLGTVQIDFFHYNKTNKSYIAHRNPETTFHIGIYHDDKCVPGWVREQEGFTGTTAQSYLNEIYGNIDLAIHGHIHTKIGMTSVQIAEDKKVPLCIPGALCVTQNKESMKHANVMLPVIEITDNSEVKMQLAKFSTHLDDLRFYEPKRKNKKSVDLESLLAEKGNIALNATNLQSLPVYLIHKGYAPSTMRFIDAAVANTLDIYTAAQLLREVKENAGTD